MAEHVNIQDPNIHETKGASTAVEGQFLRADGLGNTAFADLPTELKALESFTTRSLVSQELSTQGSEVQVTLGTVETSPNGYFSVDALGTITVLKSSVLSMELSGECSRTTDNSEVILMFRTEVGGVESEGAVALSIDNATVATQNPITSSSTLSVPAGATIKVFMGLEQITNGSAGLYPFVPTNLTSYPSVPSASVSLVVLGV